MTRPFCEHIDAHPREPSDRATALIPNGTLEMFFDDGRSDPAGDLGVPDDAFLVTFAGTHGIAQSLPSGRSTPPAWSTAGVTSPSWAKAR